MSVAVVLVAAGKGERLGLGLPKAEAKVAGKTLIEHALASLFGFEFDELVVVCPAGSEDKFRLLASACGFPNATVVVGGATRQQSVAIGLAAVTSAKTLVHDVARAFMPAEVFFKVASALDEHVCVIPALQAVDSLKEVHSSFVTKAVDREFIYRAQTPQGFQTAVLKDLLAITEQDFTDEAGLMQQHGIPVLVVPGSEFGHKVTSPSDLDWASGLFGSPRVGIGTDAHVFSQTGTLVLGCLDWPGYHKLEGHSDGDSVAHSIVDALLGAAGLGDIGSNFGVDRPEYQGASGEVFLRATLKLLEDAGFAPVNVSAQIIADSPKVGPRRSELEAKLSQIIGAPVSISATTTDGLGFLADSRGIAAVATAALTRRG